MILFNCCRSFKPYFDIMDDYGYNIGRVAFNVRHYRPDNSYDYEQLEPLEEVNDNETDDSMINNDEEEDFEYEDKMYDDDNFDDEIKTNKQNKLSTLANIDDNNDKNESIKTNNLENDSDEHYHNDDKKILNEYRKTENNNQPKKVSLTIPNQSLIMKVYRGPTKIIDNKPFASWGYFIKFPNS